MENTAKQNYPGLVASYDTRLGNKVGLFYNAPKCTWGIEIIDVIDTDTLTQHRHKAALQTIQKHYSIYNCPRLSRCKYWIGLCSVLRPRPHSIWEIQVVSYVTHCHKTAGSVPTVIYSQQVTIMSCDVSTLITRSGSLLMVKVNFNSINWNWIDFVGNNVAHSWWLGSISTSSSGATIGDIIHAVPLLYYL